MSKNNIATIIEFFEKEVAPLEMEHIISEVVDDYAEYVVAMPSDERPPNCKEKLVQLRLFRDALREAIHR